MKAYLCAAMNPNSRGWFGVAIYTQGLDGTGSWWAVSQPNVEFLSWMMAWVTLYFISYFHAIDLNISSSLTSMPTPCNRIHGINVTSPQPGSRLFVLSKAGWNASSILCWHFICQAFRLMKCFVLGGGSICFWTFSVDHTHCQIL